MSAGKASARPGPPVLLVVAGSPYAARPVDRAADRAERRIGLPVQATVRSRDAWRRADDGFLATVKSRPHLVLLTSNDDTGDR